MRVSPSFVLEFKRQFVHIFSGILMAALVWFAKPLLGFYILVPMVTLVFLLWTIPRIMPNIPVVRDLIFHFEREEDIKNFPFKGAFWYNVGIILPVILLERNIACAIIVILSLGDGMSTIVGKFFGKHRIGRKSIEGFLSFFTFSALGAGVIVEPVTAITLALIGGLIEMVEFFDDNLMIPVGLTLTAMLLGL